MAQPGTAGVIKLALKGLYTNPSTFGGNAPEGALTVANNVVIDRPSVVATRRGFDNTYTTMVNTGVSELFTYNNVKIAHGTDNKMYSDALNNGVFTAYTGTYQKPTPAGPSKMRAVESNRNFYFQTDLGLYRLDRVSGQPRLAGAPQGLMGTGVTTGTTGFIPNNTNIAYRVVFGYRDFNGQLVLGAPSSRIIVSNSAGGGSTNAIVTFQVPPEIVANPTNWIYQLYRGNASANLATQPDDEMALCFEAVCTATTTITVTDITPQVLLGAALYTNQGQQGILQSNFRAPWGTDICTFKQYTFIANTRTQHVSLLTLIASGATAGAGALVPGDTITFTDTSVGGTSFTLTAAAANNNALGQFAVANTGNPGSDIQVTATNICAVANAYTSNSIVLGYYLSNFNETPGKMEFDKRDFAVAPFTITTSRPTAFSQTIPVTSTNTQRANRIYFSKFSEPDAYPVVNYLDVGSANQPINRIIPLRDGIIVLKQDGIFRISNNTDPFNITPIDNTARILADNTAAVLNNQVYFLSDQGVVAVTDSDVQIMSFILDKTILQNTSPTLYPNLQATAWGVAYQADRKYILSLPTTGTDTQATQQYIYNHATEVWTRWTIAANCGLEYAGGAPSDGKLYLGTLAGSATATNSYIYRERKTFTSSDYTDNQYTVALTAPSVTTTVIITTPTLPPGVTIQPGWTLVQPSTNTQADIVSVNVVGGTTVLVMDTLTQWDTSPAILYVPIATEVQTIQIDCDNPAMNKQFSEIIYVFTDQGFTQLTTGITSNTTATQIIDLISPDQLNGWGLPEWGNSPWGGAIGGQGKIRRYVPQKLMRAGWLYVNIKNAKAFASFGWSGFEIYYKNTSTRQK